MHFYTPNWPDSNTDVEIEKSKEKQNQNKKKNGFEKSEIEID